MAVHDYDLVIVGAGSGNMLVSDELGGWKVAIVEGDRFGGTCLNRGCIPSKMFVYAADVASTVRHADRYGIKAKFSGADWPAIKDRVFGRIDPLHDGAVKYRRENGIDVYASPGAFIGPGVLAVGSDELRSTRFVLAAGSRPAIPALPGLADVPYYTSDTIMRLKSLPKSMIVLGGGYIGAEMSHVFGSLGTKITIVNRNQQLLALHDLDVSRRFTEVYQRRFDVRLGATVQRVSSARHGVKVELATPAGPQAVEAEILLVATGRVPNSDTLNVGAAGIATDEHGHVKTDLSYATNVPGIWAFGDLANHFQLKHMANAEARLVQYNVLHPDAPRMSQFKVVPAAVFADPQVASVGLTEQALKASGQRYVPSFRPYSDTAYGWAMEDTTSFAKVLADPDTRQLLGAHIMGPQASTLIQPLIQAMCLGNTVDQVASEVLFIHPALSEVVEQALLGLPRR
jgi:mycothione reductase